VIPFQHDDGGRAAAGYKGAAGDCVPRAIAIATGLDYALVYDDLFERNRVANKRTGVTASPRDGGTNRKTIRRYFEDLGWTWTPVHLRSDELPGGRLVVSLSRHMAAVIDGVLHDTYDCSRDGTRCVYGYWTPSS
jgi:hypothetical protein